jgi:hypothetical protein
MELLLSAVRATKTSNTKVARTAKNGTMSNTWRVFQRNFLAFQVSASL